MQPAIQATEFGSITVDDEVYDHDVVIRLSGKVKKRKKKLSKEQYGTSHTVSLAEAEHIYDDDAEQLVVGTGQYGNVKLSEEAEDYFKEKRCSVELVPTPEELVISLVQEGTVPCPCGDGILTECPHALAVRVETYGIVVVATNGVVGVLTQPAEALDRQRSIIYHVAAKGHGIILRLSRKHRFQGCPITVEIREEEEFHGNRPTFFFHPRPR